MSLLNDALRKRKTELRENIFASPIQKQKLAASKGNIAKYSPLILLSAAFLFILFGVWYLIFRSVPPHEGPSVVTKQIINKDFSEKRESVIYCPPREPKPLHSSNKEILMARHTVSAEIKHKAKPEVISEIKHDEKKMSLSPTKNKARLKPEIKKATTFSKPAPVKEKNKPEEKDEKANEYIFYQKALSYHKRNMLKEASKMYLEVLKIKPQHYDALFNLAAVYMKTATYSKAYPLLLKLKNSDPENAQVLLNLAITEIGVGRPDEAIYYLNMAEKKNGESQFDIYLHKGVAYSQLNSLDEALIWYRKAQKLEPDNCHLIFNIAVVYDKLQRYDEALFHYEIFLKNKDALSCLEKNDVKSRIRTLKTYLEAKKDTNH